MKKLFLMVIVTAFFLTMSWVKAEKDDENIIQIRERMFLGQVNDVYLNTDDYLGKTIKLEGILFSGQAGEDTYYFVARFGPGGCCGIDGLVGFEVAWTGNRNQMYPENDSWVEAVGELKTYEKLGFQFLYLDLDSLNALDVRGKEFITQ